MRGFTSHSESGCTVLFFHIPKTAGQTLNTVIQRQYNPSSIYKTTTESFWESLDLFKALPAAKRNSYQLIMGHMIFGFHEFLSRPYTYITILRDPIERIISYYYYILRYPGSYLHHIVTSRQMSLEELVRSGISKEFNNLQVRRLSAKDKVDFGQCSYEMLDQATRNLQLHFGVVGTVNRFDESLLLMKSSFGWRNCFYEKKNVTRNRPKIQDISRDVISVIEQYNQLDMELYGFAERMLEDRIRQLGDSFNKKLNKFRRLNTIYQKFYPGIFSFKNRFFEKV